MPAIVGLLFLFLLLLALGLLAWRIFRPCNPKFPAHYIHLRIRRCYNKMAFHPGDQRTLVATADGDGQMVGLAVTSSDPSVVSVTATADPTRFTLDFVGLGHADLLASATNSEGNPISGSIGVDDVAPAATSITLTVE